MCTLVGLDSKAPKNLSVSVIFVDEIPSFRRDGRQFPRIFQKEDGGKSRLVFCPVYIVRGLRLALTDTAQILPEIIFIEQAVLLCRRFHQVQKKNTLSLSLQILL